MTQGNPAERLHRIIAAFSREGDGTKLSTVLVKLSAPVLVSEDEEIDQKQGAISDAQLLQLYGALVALPGDIRVAVDRLPRDTEDVDHLQAPLQHVQSALTKWGLHGLWKNYKTVITPQIISDLKHTAQALRRNGWPDNIVENEPLANLHRQVAELFDEVWKADLNDDLRRFVLRHLDRIERGVRHYQVEGSPPLEDAVDLFIGDMVRDAGEADRRGIRKFVEEDALGRRLMRVIGEVNGVLAFAQWTLDAASGISLPPLGG